MTAPPMEWQIVRPVRAGEDARPVWRTAERWTWRIRTLDGELSGSPL